MLKKRIRKLNNKQNDKEGPVTYVMSRDQRVNDNHALLAAAKHAKKQDKQLIVLFVLYERLKNRYYQHFEFMLEGLSELSVRLERLHIPFVLASGNPSKEIKEFCEQVESSVLYFDFSPLQGSKKIKEEIAKELDIPAYVVDTHNIVPVWEASDKEEYAARTIRRKINKKLEEFLVEIEKLPKFAKTNLKLRTISNLLISPSKEDLLQKLKESNIKKIEDYNLSFKSGEQAASKRLAEFLRKDMEDYGEKRNNPEKNHLSQMSPYLHFGQIASLRIALEVNKLKDSNASKKFEQSIESYLEELIVRKELSDNFCYYNKNYDSIIGAKEWARKTLRDHENDKRENIYSLEELENAETHDPAWNASQKEMMKAGKMHGYMRMYWCKKILEWSRSAEEAIDRAIYLNDKYNLDGHDPNGYVGIMWSICGIHDRGWTEREIFGKIRYMNYTGLKRKFNIEEYIKRWN